MTGRPSLLALACVAVGCGCQTPAATRSDCEQIFERIVEIELMETGYRDPALAQRYRRSLRTRFRSQVDECVGRTLRPGAMACVQRATTTEQLSHECLE